MANRTESQEEFRKKLFLGLEKTWEKLIATKIKEGQPLVVSRDGRVVLLDPSTMQEIKAVD